MPIVLRALRETATYPVAVVNVVDDGGSSGRLREQLGIIPPGDIRNSLVALSRKQRLAQVLQYRFEEGKDLAGHSLGNLFLAALIKENQGDVVKTLRQAHLLLDIYGEVWPVTLEKVLLKARLASGEMTGGQARIARTKGVKQVVLEPFGVKVYPQVGQAIEEADVVVIAPGSLYTSVIPTLLPQGVVEAIAKSSAYRVYLGNLANNLPETYGYNASQHLQAIFDHVILPPFDLMVFQEPFSRKDDNLPDLVKLDDGVESFGSEVWLRDVYEDATHHSSLKLKEVFKEIMRERCLSVLD